MPQIFPLLWLILFISSSLALSAAISNIFFQNNQISSSLSEKTSQPSHLWNW